MKSSTRFRAAPTMLVAAALLHHANGSGAITAYGPDGCVTLALSPAGTCTFSTNCDGKDISKVEFAFDCYAKNGGIVRHSFGTGGFDADEDFDSNIQCGKCAVPSSIALMKGTRESNTFLRPRTVEAKMIRDEAGEFHVGSGMRTDTLATNDPTNADVQQPLQKHDSAEELKKRQPQGAEVQPSVEGLKVTNTNIVPNSFAIQHLGGKTHSANEEIHYGPNGCVSVTTETHCIMKTKCRASDIVDYEFGLVCVNKDDGGVRHSFGKGSFDPEETFDTLIVCDKCLGLTDTVSLTAVQEQVHELAKEVADLAVKLENVSAEVKELKKGRQSGPRVAALVGSDPREGDPNSAFVPAFVRSRSDSAMDEEAGGLRYARSRQAARRSRQRRFRMRRRSGADERAEALEEQEEDEGGDDEEGQEEEPDAEEDEHQQREREQDRLLAQKQLMVRQQFDEKASGHMEAESRQLRKQDAFGKAKDSAEAQESVPMRTMSVAEQRALFGAQEDDDDMDTE